LSLLFEPLTLRGTVLPNRIAASPMCQYSATGGLANDWHLVHLGGFAVGGAGLVLTEATAVLPEGRISAEDLGLWSDAQIEPLGRISRFVAAQGAVAGIQLAHAGRKASTRSPWAGRPGTVPAAEGGWGTVGPSAIPFDPQHLPPHALDEAEIRGITAAFADAARRALAAGFRVAELHAAHGYLLHQFLSPLSNRREDGYGGPFKHRIRFLLEVAAAVRAVWPERQPLMVRLSATDWVAGGWTPEETVAVSGRLKALGVDLIDVSSGGSVPQAQVPLGPGYQTGFAQQVRHGAGIPSGAVGLITQPAQAEHILRTGQADLILLGRELLRDPRWPLHAAAVLGDGQVPWPVQYSRVAPAGTPIRQPLHPA